MQSVTKGIAPEETILVPLERFKNHWENTQKFGSCPLRSKTLVFPGFFAFLANCFGFPAYPCMSMPAGAASSCALPCPLVSRPVSRQSRL
jgi:hypothetical protein